MPRTFMLASAPIIDHGAPTFFIAGKESEYIGNGLIQSAYYRLQKCGGDCRIVECRLVFHVQDIPAMRRETDHVIQQAFGNDRMLM